MKNILQMAIACFFFGFLHAQGPIDVDLSENNTQTVTIPVGTKEIRFTGFSRSDFELYVMDRGRPHDHAVTILPQEHGIRSDNTVIQLTDGKLFGNKFLDPGPGIIWVKYGSGTPAVVTPTTPAAGTEQPPSAAATMKPYVDALAIDRLLKENNSAAAEKILWAYYSGDICCNAFIKAAGFRYLDGTNKPEELVAEGVDIGKSAGSQSGAGLFSPTVVADALGTFIAKRFKEEINAAYLIRFREALERSDELKRLFPESYQVLSQSDPYNYTSFLEILHEAFHQDLQYIPQNTVNYLKFNRLFFKDEGFIDILAVAVHFYSGVKNGRNGLDVISGLAGSEVVSDIEDKKLKAGIVLLSVLSSGAGDTPFTIQELKELSASARLLNLYIGLVIEKERKPLKETEIETGMSLYTWLNNKQQGIGNDILKEIEVLSKGTNRVKEIQAKINEEKERAEDAESKPQLVSLYVDLLDTGIGILKDSYGFVRGLATELPQNPDNYFKLAQNIIPVVRNVSAGNYGLALSNSVALLQSFKLADRKTLAKVVEGEAGKASINKDDREKITVFLETNPTSKQIREFRLRAGTALHKNEKDYIDTLDTLFQKDRTLAVSIGNSENVGLLFKYGSFIVTVAKAESAADMVQALETAALPVGSYRIKRNNRFNLAVNAYGGGFGALEWSVVDEKPTQRSFSWGATAPVGISFSWGCSRGRDVMKRDGSSNGGFVSLIDVGGIFAFRLKDGASTLPELSWSNLIAPGLHYVHGFRNSPLSLAIGAQYGPGLRKIEIESAVTDVSAWRAGVSLTADIPLFNLSTKLYKIKK